MKKDFFSVGETAKQVRMTSETLRHYDRIGLVKPSRVDPQTGYRNYNAEDIVRLNTVRALQQMDLPLQEIRQVLEYDDLEKIIAFLEQAEQKADEKIASLQYSKSKIQLARAGYEKKLHVRQAPEGIFVKKFPKRVIMLADPAETVTAAYLWSYQRHFYGQLPDEQKDLFAFEDLAGIYRDSSSSRYFTVCTRYAEIRGLKTLPAGSYLCADCAEEDRQETLEKLLDTGRTQYHIEPGFSLQLVVISGILQWKYQFQIYAGS